MLTDKNGRYWAKWNQTYTRIEKISSNNNRKMCEQAPIEEEIKKPTD